MSKLICNDCGEIFDEDEAEERHEYVSEFWGSPAYQDILVCPCCGSDDLEDYEEDEEEPEEEDKGEEE